MTKHESYNDHGEVDRVRLDEFNNPGYIMLRKNGLNSNIEIGVMGREVFPFTLGEHEMSVLKSLIYDGEREIEKARREASKS